ncbi:hypothetical protein QQ045_027041 [Rhodiola kirilowii]
MGACSSRPRVLEDENRMPVPLPEAAAADNAVLKKEEDIFQDTLEHDPDKVPAKEQPDAVEEPEAQMVVEKHVVEATAAAIDVEVPIESEESDKVEVLDVGQSNQVEASVTDVVSNNVDPSMGNVTVETMLDETVGEPEAASLQNKETAQEGSAPSLPESRTTLPASAEAAQEGIAEAEPKIEELQSSEEAAAQEGSGPALSESEGKQGTSESPAGNHFQSFMSNVTRGWGWR